MGTQESGYDPQLLFRVGGKSLYCFKHTQLGLGVESVAALGLDCCDACLDHTVYEPLRLRDKSLYALATGGVDSTLYATSALHNAHVGVTLQTPLELVRTVAAEDEVSVGVHKAGEYGAAFGINMGVLIGISAIGPM